MTWNTRHFNIFVFKIQMITKQNCLHLYGTRRRVAVVIYQMLHAYFDSEMTFRTHIKRLARKCFYQLRQLGTVRGALTLDASKVVVHAFDFVAWTTATAFPVSFVWSTCALFSLFWPPPPVSSQDEGSMTTSQTSSVTNCTGFLSPKGLNTSCAFSSTNVFTSWRRSTLSRCAK